ncbi:MAG: hypothetical protein CMJ32_00080 [Phycisphaerae bacterium]|nr:hypothetical protein [Phycisphaerae bacterium]
MNLGKHPWQGVSPNLFTECGCYPPPHERSKVVVRPTKEEKVQAILDARQQVAEYLNNIGKIEAFADFSKDEICGLIRAAQEGVQASLQKQTSDAFEDSEIPF